MRRIIVPVRIACLLAAVISQSVQVGYSTVLGTVRGIVHDPSHRPIQGAQVELRGQASDWTQAAVTDVDGDFQFMAVPAGQYTVRVSYPGFRLAEQHIVVQSGSAPVLHFALALAEVKQTVEVTAAPEWIDPQSSTTSSMVNRQEIERAPGADDTNSLAMITDFVPGAYIVHNQLHIRGGHQVTWLVDGIPVTNTNIAGNVGPQIDPKDIDYLEVQRGGYSAEYGERAFGVFNVVPRSGFERNSEAELAAGFGSFYTTNDQFSLGSHTQRFAYYASLTGNRSSLGLQTPGPEVLHDLSSGIGGFTSLTFNLTHADQFRLAASIRGDHYQVPNTPDQQALGTRDVQQERDGFANFSWLHTVSQSTLLTISPYYHRNRISFEGGPADTPVIAKDEHSSAYLGGQVALSVVTRKHNARVGATGVVQHDSIRFGLRSAEQDGPALEQAVRLQGSMESGYMEDQYKLNPWLTLNGGIRLSHFSGQLSESAASPRLGTALRLPHTNWVVRGFYGRYYQPPPLSTVSGPLLEFAVQEGFGFIPLRGERDEQYAIGLAIPLFGWAVDIDHFHLNARNYFDHDVLGNSNIFFPLTIARARIRGWEADIRSPRLGGRAELRFSYSRQFAQGQGGVTGGLTDFSPPEAGFFFLDHDQRNTLAGGFNVDLPWRAWVAGNVAYGSGFLDGDGPAHLPGHTTFDLSLGKSFGEKVSLRLTALNLANGRYLLDNSNTFGGTHFNCPRQISVTVRYRFRY
jgi:outer membrane cobalamin receptor